jgi:hypothetical protein
MRVVIQVTSGPLQGHKRWLRNDQMLQIGRSDLADFAIEHDDQMDDIHFGVVVHEAKCLVWNLSAGSRTFVEGTRVDQSHELHHGQQIVAGSTSFVALIERKSADAAAQDSPDSRRESAYHAEKSPGNLSVLVGDSEALPPITVVSQLSEHLRLFLAVYVGDFAGDESRVDESSWEVSYPVVVPADQVDSSTELIEEYWINDAIVCLFSQSTRQQLFAQLEASAFTFSRPMTLREHLNHSPPDLARYIMKGISAIMLRDADKKSWRLYLNPEAGLTWRELGFDRTS